MSFTLNTLSSLKNETFLFLREPWCTPSLCTKACEDAGFIPNIGFTRLRGENIVNLVGKGMGVPLLNLKPIEHLLNPDICFVDIAPYYTTTINLAYRKDLKLMLHSANLLNMWDKKVKIRASIGEALFIIICETIYFIVLQYSLPIHTILQNP